MKHQKKKKKEKRKERKQQKRNPQQPFQKWLTPERDKQIREMAKLLTNMPSRYPREIHNNKFFCDKCKRAYCIHINGDGITFCDECWLGKCKKEIKGIMDCENHRR